MVYDYYSFRTEEIQNGDCYYKRYENLVIIFAISKCEFYNFEKEYIKYAHIQNKIVLFIYVLLFCLLLE